MYYIIIVYCTSISPFNQFVVPPGSDFDAEIKAAEVSTLSIDESPLTGETLPVVKNEKRPFLFSGCQVGEGSGLMLVTTVGANSSAGKIQEILNEQQKTETQLQLKLEELAIIIGKVGFLASALTLLGMMGVLIYTVVEVQNGEFKSENGIYILHSIMISVTVIVVAVPEGLPLAVAISLAFSVFKMIKDNCFVRHLSAAEIMGEATCICTDKTGTLTENRMTVVKGLLSFDEVGSDGRKKSNFGCEIAVTGDVISSATNGEGSKGKCRQRVGIFNIITLLF